MSTAMKPTTAIELELLPDDGFRYELIQGELIQMSPAGEEHGSTGQLFGVYFGYHVATHKLGRIYLAETGFKLESSPDTVCAPDFAFIRTDRLPLIIRREGYIEIAPDLVVEVLSPSDRISKLKQKVQAWLDFGTSVVVTINPRHCETTIYRSRTEIKILTRDETLEFPDLAPGWSLALGEIFQ
jgi:Uma2 family endonuclease